MAILGWMERAEARRSRESCQTRGIATRGEGDGRWQGDTVEMTV